MLPTQILLEIFLDIDTPNFFTHVIFKKLFPPDWCGRLWEILNLPTYILLLALD